MTPKFSPITDAAGRDAEYTETVLGRKRAIAVVFLAHAARAEPASEGMRVRTVTDEADTFRRGGGLSAGFLSPCWSFTPSRQERGYQFRTCGIETALGNDQV